MSQTKIVKAVRERVVQIALEYRDKCQAEFERMDNNGYAPDGSKVLGDPDRVLGKIWASNEIATLLHKRL